MKRITDKQFIEQYLEDTSRIIEDIGYSDLEHIIELLFEAWRKGTTVFVMGNGGSASTASHFAADLAKYTIVKKYAYKKRFKVLCLTDNVATTSAWTNDYGFETIFSEQMEPWIKKDDIALAFSVHGGSGTMDSGKGSWSQNIPRALELAKKKNAKTIGFAGDTGGVMKQICDVCVVIPTVQKDMITPQVEGLHVVLHHLIVHRLKQLILGWEE